MLSVYHTYTDDALLNAWKSGDSYAFEFFCKKYFLRLAETALQKTKDWHLSEELTQDALYLLFKNSFKVIDHPMAYCNEILKNKIIDHFRKKKLSILPDYESTALSVTAAPHFNTVEYKELEAEIQFSVEALPDQCRKVFLLRREDNLSNQEVADQLGISIKTVENHMTKALKYLRRELDDKILLVILCSEIIQSDVTKSLFN